MNYYQRIRDLREDEQYTQKFVADYLNIQLTTYRRYELGDREPPAWLIIKLSELYDVSSDYILGICKTKIPLTNSKNKIG